MYVSREGLLLACEKVEGMERSEALRRDTYRGTNSYMYELELYVRDLKTCLGQLVTLIMVLTLILDQAEVYRNTILVMGVVIGKINESHYTAECLIHAAAHSSSVSPLYAERTR